MSKTWFRYLMSCENNSPKMSQVIQQSDASSCLAAWGLCDNQWFPTLNTGMANFKLAYIWTYTTESINPHVRYIGIHIYVPYLLLLLGEGLFSPPFSANVHLVCSLQGQFNMFCLSCSDTDYGAAVCATVFFLILTRWCVDGTGTLICNTYLSQVLYHSLTLTRCFSCFTALLEALLSSV